MAHMRPYADYFAAYHVDTNCGTEIVPESICGTEDSLLSYCEGNRIEEVERKEGWYGRLSAQGYIDCTEWQGPYATREEAIKEVCDTYEVDANGESGAT